MQCLECALHPAVAVLLSEDHQGKAPGGQRVPPGQAAGQTVLLRIALAVPEVEYVIDVAWIVRCPAQTLPDNRGRALDLVNGDLVPDVRAPGAIIAVSEVNLDRAGRTSTAQVRHASGSA